MHKNITQIWLFIVATALTSCSSGEAGEVEQIYNPDPPAPTYTLAYEGNGHTVGEVPASTTLKANTTLSLAASGTLAREGYIFEGWSLSADGSSGIFDENETYTLGDSDVTLYAQWLNKIVYHALSTANVIDILNVAPIDENSWYYATIDFTDGTLLLDDIHNNFAFQFHYHGINYPTDIDYGFLRISHNTAFHSVTVPDTNEVLALSLGELIDASLFGPFRTAEISGYFYNWPDQDHVYIPAYITIDNLVHFGYLQVSYADELGQLTIHAIAYNRVPGEAIVAGENGES